MKKAIIAILAISVIVTLYVAFSSSEKDSSFAVATVTIDGQNATIEGNIFGGLGNFATSSYEVKDDGIYITPKYSYFGGTKGTFYIEINESSIGEDTKFYIQGKSSDDVNEIVNSKEVM